jgi:methylated-DNA-[protein]-cysteine S-methyltransferase
VNRRHSAWVALYSSQQALTRLRTRIVAPQPSMKRQPPQLSDEYYALFETSIGSCALSWNEEGVSGVWFPEASNAHTRERIWSEHPGIREAVPEGWAQTAIEKIRRLLEGHAPDLSNIPLDLRKVPPFHRKVYAAARRIPPGKTMSYAELAEAAGSPRGSRAVGQAMARNPFPILVPCHRVLASRGKLGGFSGAGGLDTKRLLLSIEQSELFRAFS